MELKSSLLDCFKYDEKHTAVSLAQELKRVTREWGAETKIVAVVSDKAANIVAAVRLTEWSRSDLWYDHNVEEARIRKQVVMGYLKTLSQKEPRNITKNLNRGRYSNLVPPNSVMQSEPLPLR
jgi:hypothetical protein